MAPVKMKAVVVVAKGEVALKDIDVPALGPKQVLIKVAAVAQNPTDWKTVAFAGAVGATVGCDFAGTVVEIGSEVPAGVTGKGARVAGFLHGAASPDEPGSFAEYLVADPELLISLPDSLAFEDAAGLGITTFTTCQTLYQSQDLPTPFNPTSKPFTILVWSGASAVGQYVIQFAKLGGLDVITTASPKNHAYLTSLGVSACFDYKDPDVATKIREYTQGKLAHVVDCISTKESVQQIAAAIGPAGGTISHILNYESPRPDVKAVVSLAYTLMGQDIHFPREWKANEEHHELGKKFAKLISDVLKLGVLKTTPLRLLPNGLASVAEGLQIHKEGKVSGEKLTYRIVDTP